VARRARTRRRRGGTRTRRRGITLSRGTLFGLLALGAIIIIAANSSLGGCGALAEPNAAPHRTTPHPSPRVTDPSSPDPKVAVAKPPLTLAAATSALNHLRVAGRGPLTGYNRDRFGPAWSDDVSVPGGHNGCDTRNDVLHARLVRITVKPGTHNCIVLSGTLLDPYTGHSLSFHRDQNAAAVQIDHIVPLAEAWRSGAARWTTDQRRNLANDPAELAPVDGRANESKGDSGPDSWRPPNRGAWCWYATTYINVKSQYHLSVQQSEKDALVDMLRNCR
jgi:Protein of unknown function (DUF1524)